MVIKVFIQIFLLTFAISISAMLRTYKPRGVKVCSSMNRNIMHKAFDKFLDSAKRELLVSIFTFCDKDAARKLILAKARGVKVNVVMQEPTDAQVYKMLKSWKIPVSLFKNNSAGTIMHNKYVVADRRKVWTGSMNFTKPAYFSNFENAVILYSRAIARYYSQDFENIKNKIKEQEEVEQNKLRQKQRIMSQEYANCMAMIIKFKKAMRQSARSK